MNKVCDVSPITYYAIHVIPESRLYTFKKTYKGEPVYSFHLQPMSPMINNYDPNLKIFESIVKDIHNIFNNVSLLSSVISNTTSWYFTFNMSIFKDGCSYSTYNSDFMAWASLIDIPIFTSAEKAKEFLVDQLRIINMANTYIEFQGNNKVEWNASELEIVSLTQSDVLQLSKSKTLVVNPYVPAFF